MRRAAELHRERRDELAAIIVREMGKPLSAALGEVDFAADITEYYADNAEKITGDQPIDILGEGTAVIRRSPIGALLGIMPWNFPYYQVARFAAPNLVIGNTILLKHAPQCPESAAAIDQLYQDAGLPAGAYVNIYATNDQAATVIADPRVHGVSVTGSERAGAAVAEVAGRNLKKVALELGGSDPFILLSTDDLDGAVQSAVDARLDNTGQSCNAAKRFIVVEGLYDAFLEKFTAAMTGAKLGDPFADDTDLGPLSSVTAAERLAAQVDKAVAQGARLVAGGTRDGAFYPATVLADVTPDMDAYREEFFGPVGVVYKVADEDEAVKVANDTPFGLGSYVFTTDEAQAARVADKIDAGMVYVNVVLADSPELPFGGVKRSGTSREMGLLAADEFVNKKLIRIAG
ncbi:aldehyde dehydrogenase family protein [Microbacterium pumilum]|uniref:Aldehyde dehydrogenase family protein n=1 Tax=Microbacterium pumilum TaxID=344165 RepID=A0ABN2T0C0_9MICO